MKNEKEIVEMLEGSIQELRAYCESPEFHPNAPELVTISCPIHGENELFVSPADYANGRGCPECYPPKPPKIYETLDNLPNKYIFSGRNELIFLAERLLRLAKCWDAKSEHFLEFYVKGGALGIGLGAQTFDPSINFADEIMIEFDESESGSDGGLPN